MRGFFFSLTQQNKYLEVLTAVNPQLCLCHQVLYIQAFVLVFLLGKFMRKVFFGQLRAAEMEVITLFPLLKKKKKKMF